MLTFSSFLPQFLTFSHVYGSKKALMHKDIEAFLFFFAESS